jgi:hypothetical protein
MQQAYGVLAGTAFVSVKRQYISDFQAFILGHIPYGQVEAKDLQTGLIQLDGRSVMGTNTKPMLLWHFGGLPYPIQTAGLINYYYKRSWDGSDAMVHASILLGFQSGAAAHSFDTAPAAIFTPQGTAFTARFVSSIRAIRDGLPSATATGAQQFPDLDAFLHDQLNRLTLPNLSLPTPAPTAPSPPLSLGYPSLASSMAGIKGLSLSGGEDLLSIEFDGPARDHDSHNIFPYTLETLFNDKQKFDQILWWYFGGTAQRITKAMRIPLADDDAATRPSLFVGFSGPGTYP